MERVELVHQDDVVTVTIDGELFTVYHYQEADRPYFYPVIGPTGDNVTRHWPMKDDVHGEEKDHPHQRGLWFTHGDINGHDFWNEGQGPKIVQTGIEVESGADTGVLTTTSEWRTQEGELVCTDRRVHTFHATDAGPVMDWQVTIIASQGPIVIGDSKEGTMAIRVPATMRLTGEVGEGHIVNSEGLRDDDTWGRRAKWVDYHGPVNGKAVGIALFEHPENPRYPTWWHVRGYGLFAANPFGISSFEKKDEGAGNMEIAEGASVTFRYRLYLHEGDEAAGRVAEQYSLYVDQ